MFIVLSVGELLERTGGHVPIFIFVGSAYWLALSFLRALAPIRRTTKSSAILRLRNRCFGCGGRCLPVARLPMQKYD
jgi:hypothetical protein